MELTAPIGIIVVDDEVPQMRAICDTLRDHGYATTGFSSGKAALAVIRPGRFDILITDLMMPEMDGIALLKAAQSQDPDLMSILMTGAGTIATAVEAMKAGSFDYLLKPFKLSELLPVLSRALSVRALRLENVALQRGLRERTAELEVANRDLESFSYSVSHDLRAPLRSIGGFSQALLEDASGSLSPEAQGHLNRILSATQHMGQLIDALLSLAQVGRGSVKRSSVDMSELARGVAARLQEGSPERVGEFAIQEGVMADGDEDLLEIILENLLGNAWKFTKKREKPHISFSCQNRIYRISDNGAGFDMAHASKLFCTFQRLHQKADFEGTGIGLATVMRIVDRHGGRIWAEGHVGVGATFSFTLDAQVIVES